VQDYVNTNKLQYVYELHKLNALIGLWYFIQALVGPLKFFSGTRRVWRCVLASWLLAAIVAIPHVVVSGRTERRSLSPDTTQDTTVYYKCDMQFRLHVRMAAHTVLHVPGAITAGHPSIYHAVLLRQRRPCSLAESWYRSCKKHQPAASPLRDISQIGDGL